MKRHLTIFLLVISMAMLLMMLSFRVASALEDGPAYYHKLLENYQKNFNRPDMLAAFQATLSMEFPGVELKRVDVQLGELSIEPECEKHDMLQGRVELFLRVIRPDGTKATVYVDRTVSVIADRITGERVTGLVLSQEGAIMFDGWGWNPRAINI